MFSKELTTNKKAKAFPVLVHRDGDVCFYCKQPFVQEIPGLRRTFDHLNNDDQDNRIENLVLAHFECNQRKKNSYDMQLIAAEKLRENVRNSESEPLGESERKLNPHAATDNDDLTEGQINEVINKLVKSTLDEYLPENKEGTVSYSQMLRGITYLVIEQTKGRGSETAVRRSIDSHCSIFAPWEDYKEGKGNRVIRRRKKD